MPDFSIEKSLSCTGPIVGIDEAGRGPWAGPVVAACAYWPDFNISDDLANQINDSKKLSPKKRDILFNQIITSNAIFGIGQATAQEIDDINILQATFLAMSRAIDDIKTKGITPKFLLIDGNRLPKNWPTPAQCIIKGDSLSLNIATASIIAKVTRDTLMQSLATQHPHYAWPQNAGYGTKAHIEGINQHGITAQHRKSYAPIKKFMVEGKI